MNLPLSPRSNVPPQDTRFQISEQIRLAESRGEVIIMETQAEKMVGVDGPGAQALARWAQGATFGQVVDELMAEYEVERAKLEQDLADLIGEARRRGWMT